MKGHSTLAQYLLKFLFRRMKGSCVPWQQLWRMAACLGSWWSWWKECGMTAGPRRALPGQRSTSSATRPPSRWHQLPNSWHCCRNTVPLQNTWNHCSLTWKNGRVHKVYNTPEVFRWGKQGFRNGLFLWVCLNVFFKKSLFSLWVFLRLIKWGKGDLKQHRFT